MSQEAQVRSPHSAERQALRGRFQGTAHGRADRVIPLLSQAVLQARAYSLKSRGCVPFAVVHVDHASEALVANVMTFAAEFAADAAVGIVSAEGMSEFQGEGLEDLNIAAPYRHRQVKGIPIRADNPFSDLNQWMLKVLLAPELREGLLNAPRGRYRNGGRACSGSPGFRNDRIQVLEAATERGFPGRI